MLLEGRNLSWRYGEGPWLFKDFSISLQPGETVGLIGPSGCGKTSLGRLLAGYAKPIAISHDHALVNKICNRTVNLCSLRQINDYQS